LDFIIAPAYDIGFRSIRVIKGCRAVEIARFLNVIVPILLQRNYLHLSIFIQPFRIHTNLNQSVCLYHGIDQTGFA
jgi:hypothetical protein